jgi:hypothetical protein
VRETQGLVCYVSYLFICFETVGILYAYNYWHYQAMFFF